MLRDLRVPDRLKSLSGIFLCLAGGRGGGGWEEACGEIGGRGGDRKVAVIQRQTGRGSGRNGDGLG